MSLTHLDLFSGIGGFALAAQWAGFETIGFVEIDPYCQKVLRKHWPDVKIVGDIRDVTEETFAYTESQRINREHGNNRGTEGKNGLRSGLPDRSSTALPDSELCGHLHRQVGIKPAERGEQAQLDSESSCAIGQVAQEEQGQPITLITGGFPCQPFSVAGKRRGKEDDRFLWPEMLRVINAYKPRWVVGENVAGIIRMALDDCISDLENIGYETQAVVIPACAVNAPHRRDRVWIVGYSAREGLQNRGRTQVGIAGITQPKSERPDSSRIRLQTLCVSESGRQQEQRQSEPNRETWAGTECAGWWTVEPNVGRVANGIPARVDRLKCLGNAIVPQVAYQILKVIAEIESLATESES